MDKTAEFSEDRKYRYSLSRIWDREKGFVTFIGLNPSTADETEDDPTIRRCINYAKSWGYGGIHMVNLFAFRATDPKIMKKETNPVGPLNDLWITKQFLESKITIAAWGNHGKHMRRDIHVKKILDGSLFCLEKSKYGNPKHPLYLKKDLTPIKF
ncbi:MAG: DUF1643 domain-containing protein [Reinekea sp.]